MAKKAKKRQEPQLVPPSSSQLPAPIISALPATLPTPAASTSVPPTSASMMPATHITFCEFIELADFDTIKLFLTTAASTPEGQNLKHLWDHAFEKGQCTLLHWLDKKLNNADDRGYSQGFKEGQSSKFKVFATGLEEGCANECSEWIAAGHGDHCFSPTAVLAESGAQTETDGVGQSGLP